MDKGEEEGWRRKKREEGEGVRSGLSGEVGGVGGEEWKA